MAILLDKNSRILVQGITGSQGSFHTEQCLDYGTNVVAGVTPSKGGSFWSPGPGFERGHVSIPVFDTVARAVSETQANVSLIFVPAPFAADAILEASESGIRTIICITEGIPTLDMTRVKKRLHSNAKLPVLIGPNCPGVITPGECKAGIMPGYIHKPGSIGVISRSGTLTYEAVWQLTQAGLGQSSVVGIGGDPIPGSNFVDILQLFQEDAQTKAALLIGEIGGHLEEEAAGFYQAHRSKPLFAFIAGKTAPPGRRMGHAGAIIEGGATYESKVHALKQAGVQVIERLSEIGITVLERLRKDRVLEEAP